MNIDISLGSLHLYFGFALGFLKAICTISIFDFQGYTNSNLMALLRKIATRG
jgi:vacuolar-type H+-ATPase subunit I/STV1